MRSGSAGSTDKISASNIRLSKAQSAEHQGTPQGVPFGSKSVACAVANRVRLILAFVAECNTITDLPSYSFSYIIYCNSSTNIFSN